MYSVFEACGMDFGTKVCADTWNIGIRWFRQGLDEFQSLGSGKGFAYEFVPHVRKWCRVQDFMVLQSVMMLVMQVLHDENVLPLCSSCVL